MKNSIMKKTWGILLGFGLSLATAAFVLTGCVIEEAEKHEIVLTLSTGATAGDATVTLTIENGDKWDSDITTGVLSGLVWTFNPTANAPSRYSVVPYRRSDTELDFTFMLTSGTYTGEVSINSFSDSTFRLYTKSSSGATYFGSGATVTINDNLPVNIYVIAAASTVTLDDGTPNDNKVTLTLSGTTWKDPFPTTGWGSLWLFEPAEGTPTKVTVSRKNVTQVECAFTGATYTGNVEIDTTATYFNVLKGLTNIGSGTMAAAGSPVKIVVTADSEEESGDEPGDDDGATAQDLADALNAISAGTATVGTGANSNTVTLAKSVSLTATNSPASNPITVPAEVTLVLPGGGKTITLNGGTLTVNGTLTAVGGDLLVGTNSSGTITGTGTIQKSSASTTILVNVGSGQTLTVEGVTLKGIASNQASLVAVGGTLTLNGTKVTGNTNCTATTGGAGIRISGTGTVTLDGDAKVYGNSLTQANGGGVFVGGTGTLHIKYGKVYGSVTMGDEFETAVVDAEDREKETEGNKNTVPQSKKGDAIYWEKDATVKVTGASRSLTTTDADYVTADSTTGFYTDVSIHATAAEFWNIAAR